MLPLQFSAAPKLFPSFDDYCTIYFSSMQWDSPPPPPSAASWLLVLPPSSSDDQIIGNFESCCFNFTRTYPLYLYYFCCPSTTTTSMAKKDFTLQWLSLHPSQQQQWSSHTKEGATTQCYLNGQWRAPNPLLVIATNQLATASLLFTSSQYILYTLLHALLIADVIVICGLLKLPAV